MTTPTSFPMSFRSPRGPISRPPGTTAKEPAMPRRENTPIGAPCWVDIFTSDPDRIQAFYGELFGWTCEAGAPEFGGYFNFFKDGVQVAGGMGNDGESGPDRWSVYLATDDAAATVAAAEAKGSTAIVPAMQL